MRLLALLRRELAPIRAREMAMKAASSASKRVLAGSILPFVALAKRCHEPAQVSVRERRGGKERRDPDR